MKTQRAKTCGTLAAALIIMVVTLSSVTPAWAQHEPATTPDRAKVAPTNENRATNGPANGALSPGVSEIIKMADAGVSADVLKAYAESSAKVSEPTDQDVIAMSRHKVPDEVTTLWIKRGAQARAAVEQAKKEARARVEGGRRRAAGGLDPDSYEYFQYYYLQPRALAFAYERLSPYRYYRFHRPVRLHETLVP